MGIRKLGTPAEAERSLTHWVGAPEHHATPSTGQDGLLAAGLEAPSRVTGPSAQARTLAVVGGSRLGKAGAALLQLQRYYGNRVCNG